MCVIRFRISQIFFALMALLSACWQSLNYLKFWPLIILVGCKILLLQYSIICRVCSTNSCMFALLAFYTKDMKTLVGARDVNRLKCMEQMCVQQPSIFSNHHGLDFVGHGLFKVGCNQVFLYLACTKLFQFSVLRCVMWF